MPPIYDTIPTVEFLNLGDHQTIRALGAGLFVSRGAGAHPQRRIDSYELIWVVRGKLSLFEDANAFDLAAGQSLLFWPGRLHGGAAPYAPDCSFYWIHFRFAENEPLTAGRTVPQTATIARPERLTELFRRYLDDQESGLLTPYEGSLLMQLMLLEVCRPAAAPPQDGHAAVLARLTYQHLLQNLGGPLSTARIARALDCHPDYLGRCYRGVYGETITDAIQRERLKKARAMLLDSNDAVEAVARACGFPGVVFFRRVFKRHTGSSPSQFRKMYARVYLNTE